VRKLRCVMTPTSNGTARGGKKWDVGGERVSNHAGLCCACQIKKMQADRRQKELLAKKPPPASVRNRSQIQYESKFWYAFYGSLLSIIERPRSSKRAVQILVSFRLEEGEGWRTIMRRAN
jgi:hypothetical protein